MNFEWFLKKKQAIKRGLICLPIIILFSESSAWAYLDPGTGSLILQMVIGACAAAGFAIKVYWGKLVAFFSKKESSDKSPKPAKKTGSL
jgi:uncharacterized membrane protein